MAWMSRTLLSTFVKSASSRSSATAASRLFVACLSNWLKKKLFFGISDSRMSSPFAGHDKTARTVTPSLRDLAPDRCDGARGHHESERQEDTDVAKDQRIGELVAFDHHRPQRFVRVRERQHRGD